MPVIERYGLRIDFTDEGQSFRSRAAGVFFGYDFDQLDADPQMVEIAPALAARCSTYSRLT